MGLQAQQLYYSVGVVSKAQSKTQLKVQQAALLLSWGPGEAKNKTQMEFQVQQLYCSFGGQGEAKSKTEMGFQVQLRAKLS